MKNFNHRSRISGASTDNKTEHTMISNEKLWQIIVSFLVSQFIKGHLGVKKDVKDFERELC